MSVAAVPSGADASRRPRGIPRGILRLLLAVAMLATLLIVAVAHGSTWIEPSRVIAALVGEGTRTDATIVWSLRLPRVLLAALAGALLAAAGLLLQRAVRNDLANPSVLGIVDGAAVGAVGFLFLFSNEANILTVPIGWQPVFAVIGAVVAGVAVAALSRAGSLTGGGVRIVLYGVAVGALGKALVTLLVITGPVYLASQALIWLAGSVHHAGWDDVAVLAIALLAALPVMAAMVGRLNQLSLDPLSAEATGLPVAATRLALLALAVVLTAVAVAHAGAIGFVGLIAPHAARLAFGRRAALSLPGSLLAGAIIVVAADLIARVAFTPLEVPTGSLTALVGAPYFLFLLSREARVHG